MFFKNETVKLTRTIKDLISSNELILTKKEWHLLNHAKKQDNVQLEMLIQRAKGVSSHNDYTSTIYPGDVKFSDLKNLIEIDNNNNYKDKIFLMFDEKNIKDYDRANPIEQQEFSEAVLPTNIKFCREHAQSGLKKFDNTKSKIKISAVINQKTLQFIPIYELKIKSSPSRILVYELSPINGGPTVLVASNFIKGGEHDRRHVKGHMTGITFFTADNNNPINSEAHDYDSKPHGITR